MGAEPILYVVGAEGADKTAEAFDKVAAALERTAALQRSLTDAQAKSGELARIASYKAEAAALNGMEAAMAKATVGQTQFSQVAAGTGDNVNKLRANMSQAAAVFGQVGGSISQLIPVTGTLNTALGTSLRTFGPLLGMLGGGPGVIAGGLIAAVGGLAAAFAGAAKEADDIARATAENARALGGYIQQIGKLRSDTGGRIATNTGESALQGRLRGGDASIGEYSTERAALRELMTRKDEVEKTLQAAYTTGDRDTVVEYAKLKTKILEAPALLEQYAKFQRQANELLAAGRSNASDSKQFDMALAAGGGTPGDPDKPSSAGAGGGVNSFALAEKNQSILAKIDQIQTDNRLRLMAEEDEAASASTAAQRAAEWEASDEALKASDLQRKADTQMYQDKQKGFATEVANRKIANQMIGQGATIAIGATTKTLVAIAEGQKVSGKAILKSIGESMIAEGTRATFTGAIMLATYQPGGAVALATGLAEIGAGMGLAAGGSSGAKGGGGGGGASSPSSNAGPMRDTAASSGGGGNTFVTYVEFPTVTSPTAEDGLRVRQALGAAERSYGGQV